MTDLPPQSIGDEMSCLASMLLDDSGSILAVVSEILVAEDFYRLAHRQIFTGILSVYDRVGAVDMVMLSTELESREILDSIGGVDYLMELADHLPAATSGVYYAKTVKRYSQLRLIISACHAISNEAFDKPEIMREFLDSIDDRFANISEQIVDSTTQELIEIIPPIIEKFVSPVSVNSGLETGLVDLDELAGGLRSGEVTVVAGRPSMGKSALALNILEHIAINRPVLLFSLEMSRALIGERLISSRTAESSAFWSSPFVTDIDRENVQEVGEELTKLNIIIHDAATLTPAQLRSHVRRLHKEHKLAVVAIDYLQLMHVPHERERRLEVGVISRTVKEIARELNIPILLLSQLNRAAESREGNKPKLADLRESGDIEQDADVVLLLYRKDYYGTRDNQQYQCDNTADIIVAKNRNGATGRVKLHWDGRRTKFSNIEQPQFPEFSA